MTMGLRRRRETYGRSDVDIQDKIVCQCVTFVVLCCSYTPLLFGDLSHTHKEVIKERDAADLIGGVVVLWCNC